MRLTLSAWLFVGLCLPAAAFDCKKASMRSEKAICADQTAREADAAMSQAFSGLMASAAPAQKAMIVAAQGRWLVERDNACAEAKGAGLAACLTEESRKRRRFLSAEPESGPGAPGRLTPWFRIEKGAKGRADIALQLLRYPAPQTAAERAFDSAVDKLAGGLDEPEKDDPAADRYAYVRNLRLVYASPRLISAFLDAYNDTGGAHPGSYTGSVNIDVAAGREAQMRDLLDAKAAQKVFALCLDAVVAQKKEKMGADAALSADDVKELAKQVAEATGSLDAWSFGADKATVTYDPYAVGSYAEGAYSCDLPYATLRPLAKPSFPLP